MVTPKSFQFMNHTDVVIYLPVLIGVSPAHGQEPLPISAAVRGMGMTATWYPSYGLVSYHTILVLYIFYI